MEKTARFVVLFTREIPPKRVIPLSRVWGFRLARFLRNSTISRFPVGRARGRCPRLLSDRARFLLVPPGTVGCFGALRNVLVPLGTVSCFGA